MATKQKAKLALVPAVNILSAVSGKAPENAGIKKLNLPPLVKFGNKTGEIGIGVTVSGVLQGIVINFTGKKDMKGSKTIHLKHESGEEFLLPLTGSIKSTFRQLSDIDEENETETIREEYIGKMFFFTRRADGVSKKYPDKAMFNVDVRMAE